MSQRLRERSGGAARLTGPPRAQPMYRALQCLCRCVMERVGAQRPFCPHPLACDWTSAPALVERRESCLVDVCCPSPEPETHWRTAPVQPPLCLGRYEGTERFLGRRDPTEQSLHSSSLRRENLKKCLVQPCWGTRIRKRRRNTLPGMDCARPKAQRKKSQNSAPRGSLSLDNRGPHKGWAFLRASTSSSQSNVTPSHSAAPRPQQWPPAPSASVNWWKRFSQVNRSNSLRL